MESQPQNPEFGKNPEKTFTHVSSSFLDPLFILG